jgi:hypothetical protein
MSKRRPQRDADARVKREFTFRSFALSAEDCPKFKAAAHEAALEAVANFPKTLELVKDQLRRHDPIGIMACFTRYGLMTIGRSKEGAERKLLKDVEQHHAELLQAIVLTLPRDQGGQVPAVPDAKQIIFDSLPKLSATFFH